MSERPVRPQRGDEHELFVKYAERLRRATTAAIRTSPENVDDACAFAWMTLITNQPDDRQTVFAWLKAVARNRALELDRRERSGREISLDVANRDSYLAVASHGRPEVAQGLLEVRERLEALPQRQREMVLLNATGWRYTELAERFGVNRSRINTILAKASLRMREMDTREMEPNSRRGRRLRELENDPPQYIVASIGRRPRVIRRDAGEELKREWKRLALEIEDYRSAKGITDRVNPLGRDVNDPRRDALVRRIADYRRDRGLSLGIGR